MNLYTLFYILISLYLSLIHILPYLFRVIYFDESVTYNENDLLYPVLFIVGVSAAGCLISKLKLIKLKLRLLPEKYNFLVFGIWIVVALILQFTGNITMANVSRMSLPFLTQLKLFNSYGVIIMIHYARKFRDKNINILVFMLIVFVLLYFTFLTLSKFLIIINLFILFFVILDWKKLILFVLIPGFLYFFSLYNYLLDYRSAISSDVDVSMIQSARIQDNSDNQIVDFILDRLNYNRILRAIDENNYYLDQSPYSLVSIVPRFLYPKKSNVGVDTNKFGHEIGVLDKNDFNTSLGIGVIGESYAIYRYYGILVILFYVLLFFLFKTVNNEIFHVLMIMTFVTIDTFSYFFASLFSVFLFSFLFSGFSSRKLLKFQYDKC